MSQLQKRPKPKTTRAVMNKSFQEAFGIAKEEAEQAAPEDKKKRKKGTFDQLVEDIKGGKPLSESISEGLQRIVGKRKQRPEEEED